MDHYMWNMTGAVEFARWDDDCCHGYGYGAEDGAAHVTLCNPWGNGSGYGYSKGTAYGCGYIGQTLECYSIDGIGEGLGFCYAY